MVFQLHHLSSAPQAQQLAYGATILFSTLGTGCLQLPARQSGYVTAFRALHPHRLLPLHGMLAEAVLNEPLFFSQQVSVPLPASAASGSSSNTVGKPLTPQDQPLLLTSSITKVAHLQLALQQQHPPPLSTCLRSVLLALPQPWQAVATAAPAIAAWQQGSSPSGTQLIRDSQTGQLHSLSIQHQLLQAQAQPITATGPVHIIPWDPSRPWGGPSRPSAQSSAVLYSQGPLWGPAHLSLGVWGWGQQPAHQLVVREASQRLRLIQAQRCKVLAPGALVGRPRLLPLSGSDQSPIEVLQELESRWAASIQSTSASRPSPTQTCQTRSQPGWHLRGSQGFIGHSGSNSYRLSSSSSQLGNLVSFHQTELEQMTPSICLGRSATTLGKLWELAGAAFFNRQHRVLWWRILHGCVMCGAFRAYIGRATPEQACCPFACCSAPTQPHYPGLPCGCRGCQLALPPLASDDRLHAVATTLAASVFEGQCASDALLQTWHRVRLAVLHSIWTAASIAASSLTASLPHQPLLHRTLT